MNLKTFALAPQVIGYGSTADLHQFGAVEANTQAIDPRTRKHLLREARKANLRRAQQQRRRR
jgi:hypothetical protein